MKGFLVLALIGFGLPAWSQVLPGVWGDNSYGQMNIPTGLTNVVQLAPGGFPGTSGHCAALKADGTVVMWGASTNVPAGVTNIAAISSGSYHVLALSSNGTVMAWAYLSFGQDVVPPGLSNVVAVAGGGLHSLALKSDGTVVAWGNDCCGETDVPSGLTNVIAIGAGDEGSGALKNDGTIVTWGNTPAPPPGLSNVIAIAVGAYHVVALKNDSTVVAWGSDSGGATDVPPGLSNVVGIAAGYYQSVVLKSDGTIVAWGANDDYQGQVPFGLTNAIQIAAGGADDAVLYGGYPALVNSPSSQSVYTGMSVTFNSLAAGPPSLNYQWQTAGTNISGATNNSLTLTNLQKTDSGMYTVIVTNSYGAISNSASLTVTASKPMITQQPTNEVLPAGSNAVFVVSATGSVPLSYQWQCDSTNIPSATNTVLMVANVQPGQFFFQVMVSNNVGVTASSNATLTVPVALVSVQPQNLTTNGGTTATFNSTVIGQGPFTYQWQFDGTNITGATNASLTLTNTLACESGSYSLVVSNVYGVAVSSNATLTVLPSVTMTISPTTIIAGAGTIVSFSFDAAGFSPISYGWTQNGSPFGGPGPGSLMQIIDPPVSWAGTYNVTVTDNCATVTSSNITLTIIPLAITAQPTNAGAWIGGFARLAATVLGAKPIFYQWQMNGTNIPGANTNSLVLTNVQATQFGTYDLIVTNAYTNIMSQPVTLSLSQVAVWGGSVGESNLPPGLTNIIAVSGGSPSISDCMALKNDGTVILWPKAADSFASGSMTNLIAIAGSTVGTGLRPNGTVVALSPDGANTIGGLTNAVAIGPDNYGFLALMSNGTVVGSASIAGVTNAVAIAEGSGHSLALKANGRVVAWGNNGNGQTNVPTGLSNVMAIAAGGFHSMALKSDGTVVVWGLNNFGQTNVPPGLSNVVEIAGGVYHSLALRRDGTVVAWGYNAYGQTNVPANLTNVIAIAAGTYQSLALIGSGPPVTSAAAANPSLTNNTFSFSLPSQSGRVYDLKYMNSLMGSNWTSLPLVAGNGTLLFLKDSSATNSQRFYKVLQW